MSVENGLADVQSFKSDSQRDLGHIQQGHELPPPANGNQVSSEGGTISKATLLISKDLILFMVYSVSCFGSF